METAYLERGENEPWIPLRDVARDLGMPVELVRITAEIDLAPDAYDPALDVVSERGRDQLCDALPKPEYDLRMAVGPDSGLSWSSRWTSRSPDRLVCGGVRGQHEQASKEPVSVVVTQHRFDS